MHPAQMQTNTKPLDYYYVCYNDSIAARIKNELGIELVKKGTLWYFYGRADDYCSLVDLAINYRDNN